MVPTRTLPESLIAAHAGALRALAVTVASDRDEAAEIEQETWLRALVAPPASFERFGGWLATVARGFASKRRRARSRRVEHESACAAARSLEHADDPSRDETLRAVVDALFALDEPYRSTVFLRYFEGRSPREIAAAQRAPLATVESRLQRAHAKLRVELGRRLRVRDDGARRALLAFAGSTGLGWKTHAALGGLIGASLVSLKTKIVVVLFAAVLAWLGWQRFAHDGAAPTPAPAASVATDAPRELSSLDAPSAESASARAPIGEEPGNASTGARSSAIVLGAGPYEFELDFAPLDSGERPLAAVQVYLAPEGRPFARIGTTDWTGHLHVKWRAFAPSFDALLAADRSGFGRTAIRRVRLRAGELNEFRSAMIGPQTVMLRAALAVVEGQEGLFEVSLGSDDDTFAEREWACDEQGNAIFEDEWITPASAQAPPAVLAEATLDMLGYAETETYAAGDFLGVAIGVGGGTHLPTNAVRVEVVALDVDGAPVPDAVVTVTTEAHAARTDGKTDAEGRFRTAASSGPLEITVGGLDRPLARKRFDSAPNATIEWSATLFAERRLAGKLATLAGAPLGGWTLEVLDAGTGDCLALPTTDEQGRFLCGHAPIAPIDLVARHPESGSRFVVLRDVLPSRGDDALDLRIDPRGAKILFELVDAAGEPIADAQVRAIASDDGFGMRGRRAELPDDDPRVLWQTPELAPGGWELEVGAAARGWRRLGRFQLAAGETLELGKLRWSSTNVVVRGDGARAALAAIFEGVSAGVRVRSLPFQCELPVALPLDADVWHLASRCAELAEGACAAGEHPFGAAHVDTFDARKQRELVLAVEPPKSPSGEPTASSPGEPKSSSGEQR